MPILEVGALGTYNALGLAKANGARSYRSVKGIIACGNAGWNTNPVRLREEATLVGGYGFAFVGLS